MGNANLDTENIYIPANTLVMSAALAVIFVKLTVTYIMFRAFQWSPYYLGKQLLLSPWKIA